MNVSVKILLLFFILLLLLLLFFYSGSGQTLMNTTRKIGMDTVQTARGKLGFLYNPFKHSRFFLHKHESPSLSDFIYYLDLVLCGFSLVCPYV